MAQVQRNDAPKMRMQTNFRRNAALQAVSRKVVKPGARHPWTSGRQTESGDSRGTSKRPLECRDFDWLYQVAVEPSRTASL